MHLLSSLCPPKRSNRSVLTRDSTWSLSARSRSREIHPDCSRFRHIESRVTPPWSKRLGGQREGRRCTERRQVRGPDPVGPHGGRTATRLRGAFFSKSMKFSSAEALYVYSSKLDRRYLSLVYSFWHVVYFSSPTLLSIPSSQRPTVVRRTTVRKLLPTRYKSCSMRACTHGLNLMACLFLYVKHVSILAPIHQD